MNKRATSALLLYVFSFGASANLIDFDNLEDFAVATSGISGVDIEGLVALSAGLSLNEFQFPPRSGSIAATNESSEVIFVFGPRIFSFSAYFSYVEPFQLFAYGVNGENLGIFPSAKNSHFADGDSLVNFIHEEIKIFAEEPISKIIISSDSTYSYVVDDVTFSHVTQVPELSTSMYFIFGLTLISGCFARRKSVTLRRNLNYV